MKFHLRIYDNFHYMDESEAYNYGQYESYEKAVLAAKAIVDKILQDELNDGTAPENLFSRYCMFGEDPAVLPNEHGDMDYFSAWDYAEVAAEEICKKIREQIMDTQSIYQETIKFAAAKHLEKDQKVPGTDLPYVVHLSNVAMEILLAGQQTDNFNLGFAVRVALLHDTIEDTSTDFAELEKKFGSEVAEGVSALTKNESLPKEEQMLDCLVRIKKLSKEVWSVKLADRITNLQSPPSHWENAKKKKYIEEARIILRELRDGNVFLAKRLEGKIKEYGQYVSVGE